MRKGLISDTLLNIMSFHLVDDFAYLNLMQYINMQSIAFLNR